MMKRKISLLTTLLALVAMTPAMGLDGGAVVRPRFNAAEALRTIPEEVLAQRDLSAPIDAPSAPSGRVEWAQEFASRLESAKTVGPLSGELFGESVSLFTGALGFSATDVSLPGNSSLPVAFSRKLDTSEVGPALALGDWELDLPHLSGVFADDSSEGYWKPAARCSSQSAPPDYGSFYNFEFWSGNKLNLPGGGGGELLAMDGNPKLTVPTNGLAHKWVTKDFWFLSCLPTLQSGQAGEGFLAHAPDGTRYRFDWMVVSTTPGISMGGQHELTATVLPRVKVRLYPTRIEDRFGNWVNYVWSGNRLQSIQSNDGRQITLAYGVNGFVSSVSDGTRTWQYVVTSGQLTSVLNPDGSSWSYNNGVRPVISYSETRDGGGKLLMDRRLRCSHQRMFDTRAGYFEQSISVTHPSGAVGEFTLRPTRHGRYNVPYDCVDYNDGAWDEHWNRYPVFQDVKALVRKRITGPGIGTLSWTYDYWKNNDANGYLGGGYDASGGPFQGPPPVNTKLVTVTAPDGTKVRHSFGLDYGLNEGQLLSSDVLTAAGSVLRSTANAYIPEAQVPAQPFPDLVGTTLVGFSDPFAASALRPLKQRTITEQGTQFVLRNDSYDQFTNALTVKRFSSLTGEAGGRSEINEYHHDFTNWVLGQVKKLTVAGALVESTDFTPLSQPLNLYSNGLRVETRGYNGDGTLASVKDGLNKTTTLSSWYRGIPRSIGFADAKSISATVNALGQITATTDELGYATGFGYDPMGRVNLVTPPSSDSTAWDSTSITFAKVNADEYGLGIGHWKQSTTTGRYRKEVVFDALWRPVLAREWDSYLTNSHRYSVRAFDAEGRETFAAYPSASVGTVAAVVASGLGVSKQYDALGRMRGTAAHSEQGSLVTLIDYLSGNRKRIVNPRGQTTEIDYLQYDAPSEDSPTQIRQYPYLNAASPLATTQIGRDAWGKPQSITRSGTSPTVSATRSYVYDAYQRLCKTIEPERAAEIFHYDGASRIDWSAKGQWLMSTTNCEDTSVAAAARIARGYDPRDRLLTVNYPDTTLDESRAYYADGALKTLTRGPGTANEVRWEYQYNKRRLMTEARAHIGGQSSAMNWSYDSIGNVAGEYALNGVWTTYSPNAFGQPTLVKDPDAGRVYASSISWFPNGALAGFTYGNGVVHTLTKNARDLPWRSRDLKSATTIVDHTYTYDGVGNPTGIDDALNLDDKTLGYDSLDRLTSASGGFGTATLAYDALDNITRYALPGRDWYYDMSSNQRLLQTRDASNTPQVLFSHDARGNVTMRRDARSTQGFTYDLAERVLTTTRDGVLQATHVYDGNGLRTRTSKPTPGAPQPNRDLRFQIYTPSGVFQWENDIECSRLRSRGVNYVRLAGSLLAKVVADSTLTQAECYPGTSNSEQQVLSINPFRNPFAGATEVVAGSDGGRDGEAPSAPTSTTTYSIVYVHTDALGSPIAETNTNGTVISGSRTQYEPYGKPRTTPREGAPSYTGHQYDTSTGLIYAQQRYYDPQLGRFLSTDPMAVDMGSAGNWNRYAYANNSPYRFTDPDGREAPCITLRTNCGISPENFANNMSVIADGMDAADQFFMSLGPYGIPERGVLYPFLKFGRFLRTVTTVERAQQIHGALNPRTQRAVTTAVVETREGIRVVSSSEGRLRPAARAALREGEVEGVGKKGVHAEVNGVNAARDMGLTPTGVAPSRPPCSGCREAMRTEGIPIVRVEGRIDSARLDRK